MLLFKLCMITYSFSRPVSGFGVFERFVFKMKFWSCFLTPRFCQACVRHIICFLELKFNQHWIFEEDTEMNIWVLHISMNRPDMISTYRILQVSVQDLDNFCWPQCFLLCLHFWARWSSSFIVLVVKFWFNIFRILYSSFTLKFQCLNILKRCICLIVLRK